MPLFLLAALVSEIVGTIVGFGSSTILLPLSLFFFDFKTALVLVAFFHLFGDFIRIGLFRKGLNLKLALYVGVPGLIFSLLGAYTVAYTEVTTLKMVLGIFLVIYSALSLSHHLIKLPANIHTYVWGGSVSGFFAGLVGTGGALRSMLLNSMGMEKTRYLATAAVLGLMVDAVRIPVYISEGLLSPSAKSVLLPLVPVAIIGSVIGKKIALSLPSKRFRQFVALALLLAGVKFILG